PIIREKNIFEVVVNKNDQLLVEGELAQIKGLKQLAIDFLDNGGGVGSDACNYCKGKRNASSSDNPIKAIISLQNDRGTSYKTYIAVQNELVAAYNALRNREAQRLYGQDFTKMYADYNDPKTPKDVREELKPQVEAIQDLYPQKLSEAEPKSN